MQSRKMDMFICKLQMEKNLQVYENAKTHNVYHRYLSLFLIKPICSVLESAAEKSEMEMKWKLFLRCKYDVCVGALSVNFAVLYFM